ncbi:MAG: hypothetical protein ABJB47_20445 [Actinomycetota bacterium]
MTAPGPGGTLTSPGFLISCLWYRFAVNELVEGTVSGDPFSFSSTAIARGTGGGPIAAADGTGSVLLDVDIAANHVSGKGIIAQLLDEAALSRVRHADAGSPMANLEKAGLLPGRAYGQVLRKRLMLREQVITADRQVAVPADPGARAAGSWSDAPVCCPPPIRRSGSPPWNPAPARRRRCCGSSRSAPSSAQPAPC